MSARTDIEFDADDICLPHPLVVMSHGFSAVKEMGLDDYAEVFSAAGLAVLVYDNRNLGASDGSPRQDIDPVAQRRDQTHAITFARGLTGIDPERIGHSARASASPERTPHRQRRSSSTDRRFDDPSQTEVR